MGHFIPYAGPIRVVRSWEKPSQAVRKSARKAVTQARVTANRKRTKIKPTGSSTKAHIKSECWWCGKPIYQGKSISPVRLTNRKKVTWVHTACTDQTSPVPPKTAIRASGPRRITVEPTPVTPSIVCGYCGHKHGSVAEVKACYDRGRLS